MADAEESVWALLRGYPFGASPKPVLLIIDEAQGLVPRLLEAVRGIWDRGDAARAGNPHAPAFGCILVGNATFLGKGGVVRKALFQPLLDRVTHNMPLPRPTKAECTAFAAGRFPNDDALQAELAAHGERRGNFRSMDVAARQAVLLADGGTVTLAHLRGAIKFSGGDA
ncbi:MAG: hypothetical protein WBB85_01330 [Albidovulum sp.]|uniref:hypothetical protein n=1 Tax=Albidovulum sp. TaxID=1872424 RepID=UPI003CA75B37